MYPNNPDRIANSIIGIDWIIIAVTNRITKPEKNIRSIAFIRVFLGLDEGKHSHERLCYKSAYVP